MSGRPEYVWACAFNGLSPIAKVPVPCRWDRENRWWKWSRGSRALDAVKLGLEDHSKQTGYVTFTSTDKAEVATFMKGYTAAATAVVNCLGLSE